VSACAAAPIVTERLLLVPLRPEDADEMVDVLADRRLHQFIGGHPATLEELRDRYATLTAGSPRLEEVWRNWIVRRRADSRPVGTVQATLTRHHEGWTAQVAWIIGLPWQHQGYASEAARALVQPTHDQVDGGSGWQQPESAAIGGQVQPVGLARRADPFIPLSVHRFARERLVLAQAQGAIMRDVPEVLFVCVHNAGRSQMAAALLDHHAKGKVHVRSAGSAPADQINPAVTAAMDEWGLDLSKEFPKPLTDEFVQAADVVITMGCGDACPIYPGKRYEDWGLQDPAGQPVEVVRRIRDDIDARVQQLLTELAPASA
jgi:arsenate reductase